MIVPMKRLTVLTHYPDLEVLLAQLQDAGVVHVDINPDASANLAAGLMERKRWLDFLRFLDKQTDRPQTEANNPETLLQNFLALREEIDRLQAERNKAERAVQELSPWGDLSSVHLAALTARSVYIHRYVCSLKQLNNLADSVSRLWTVESHRSESQVWLAVINHSPDSPLPLEEAPPLTQTLAQVRQALHDLEMRSERAAAEMAALTVHREAIRQHVAHMGDELQFAEVRSSAARVHDRLAIVQGWLPAHAQQPLEQKLQKLNATHALIEEIPADTPPTAIPILLKNGPFARFFEPISKLFSLPNYMEMDLTPFLAPFYLLFFGLCVGDSLYGLVMLLACIVFAIKKPDARPLAILGALLSLSTIFWGLLTGSVGGVDAFKTQVPILSQLAVLKPDHIFNLALMLGLAQILFGMVLQMFNRSMRNGWKAALSPLGWIALIVGAVALYFAGKPNTTDFLLGHAFVGALHTIPSSTAWGLVAGGSGLILLFNDVTASLPMRIGKGLWELYGITGFVGDLLSYVRLFALGLSSAILGSVINTIAGQILDLGVPVVSQVGWFVFLVVGHAGNLAIAGLGAFVHPLRLTFVEFYKNAGFAGGGLVFRPFRKNTL